MRVLIVEDDHNEETLIRKLLGKQFKIPDEEITTLSTEEEFCNGVESIAQSANPPELVILDVMMRWTDPTVGEFDLAGVPATVRQEGPYRAGLRCAERLDELNPAIPILLYTILEREDLESDLFRRRDSDLTLARVRGRKKIAELDYARKDEDENMLIEKIRRLLKKD
jgi:CheY-like chemotaxis protein